MLTRGGKMGRWASGKCHSHICNLTPESSDGGKNKIGQAGVRGYEAADYSCEASA